MSIWYPCVYCTEDMKCNKYFDTENGVESYCCFGFCQERKQSNADRIRHMTDEALAMWLTDFCCATVGNAADARVAMYHCGMLNWLKQEAEDENNT